jgi:hypothetical protein
VDAVDEKVANFFYANNVSFLSVDSKSFVELVDALKSAPLAYKKPDRKALSGKLLDSTEKRINAAKYEHLGSIEKYGAALATDGATVHGEPLSNYVIKIPNIPKPIHLGMLNAKKHIAGGESKDADYVASGPRQSRQEPDPPHGLRLVSDPCTINKNPHHAMIIGLVVSFPPASSFSGGRRHALAYVGYNLPMTTMSKFKFAVGPGNPGARRF